MKWFFVIQLLSVIWGKTLLIMPMKNILQQNHTAGTSFMTANIWSPFESDTIKLPRTWPSTVIMTLHIYMWFHRSVMYQTVQYIQIYIFIYGPSVTCSDKQADCNVYFSLCTGAGYDRIDWCPCSCNYHLLSVSIILASLRPAAVPGLGWGQCRIYHN